jgi:predicted Zn finger-like uncharacterized protein
MCFDLRGFDRAVGDALRAADIRSECPECKAAFKITLEDVVRQRTIPCPGCRTAIKLEDKDGKVAKTLRAFR